MKGKRIILWFVAGLLLLALAACGGGDGDEESSAQEPAGDAVAGETAFNTYCIACHGEGGVGIEGLGKSLPTSEFVAGKSNTEMLEFVKIGRPIGDPLNTTGVDMPPKGGNPALTDEQILDIIAYIRTLQEQ